MVFGLSKLLGGGSSGGGKSKIFDCGAIKDAQECNQSQEEDGQGCEWKVGDLELGSLVDKSNKPQGCFRHPDKKL